MIKIDLTLVGTIINFFVLVYLLKLVLFKPVTKLLADREAAINNRIEAAKQKEAEAERLKKQLEQELEASRQEAKNIIQRATEQGEAAKQEIIAKARVEAERLLKQAQTEMQLERERTLAELQRHVVDLAMAAAQKVVGETSSEERQRRLIEGFLASLEPEMIAGEQD